MPLYIDRDPSRGRAAAWSFANCNEDDVVAVSVAYLNHLLVTPCEHIVSIYTVLKRMRSNFKSLHSWVKQI